MGITCPSSAFDRSARRTLQYGSLYTSTLAQGQAFLPHTPSTHTLLQATCLGDSLCSKCLADSSTLNGTSLPVSSVRSVTSVKNESRKVHALHTVQPGHGSNLNLSNEQGLSCPPFPSPFFRCALNACAPHWPLPPSSPATTASHNKSPTADKEQCVESEHSVGITPMAAPQ